MSSINELARALVFACSDENLSLLASDNPRHGNQWPGQKLSRDTVRMLSTFVHQFSAEWHKRRKDVPDWHNVGLVLAQCGTGYDDYGQEPLFEACKRAIREVWAGYSDNASWRRTKQGTLHLDCIPPQTPNPKRGSSKIMSPNKLWKNDKVQFARLLCELVANWDDKESKTTIRAVADAMDLGVDDINELFDRADAAWEKAKAKV